MEITRKGSSSNHGRSSIDLSGATASWDNHSQCVVLKKGYVKDFNGNAEHHYEVKISSSDFQAMAVEISSNNKTKDFGGVESFLTSSLRSLIRMVSIASGVYPSEVENESKTINISLKKGSQ